MKILKEGKIEAVPHFVCEKCECEWVTDEVVEFIVEFVNKEPKPIKSLKAKCPNCGYYQIKS